MPTKRILASGDERSSDELFAGMSALVRDSGQSAVIAAVVLLMVLASVISQLLSGPDLTIARAVLLIPMIGAFAVSAALAARSRQILVRALSEMRARTGAPVDVRAPWTSLGAEVPLGEEALQHEARRLIGAAWLCGELAWRALRWAMATGLLFLLWTIAAI